MYLGGGDFRLEVIFHSGKYGIYTSSLFALRDLEVYAAYYRPSSQGQHNPKCCPKE